MIKPVTHEHLSSIVSIYNHYIKHSHSTFELDPIDETEMKTRVNKVLRDFHLPWLVSIEEGKVVGYAYATQWKARVAYSRTTETSIYIHKDHGGRGYGKKLYKVLLEELKAVGYHAIVGGISLPNDASISLHESLGFEKIARFKEVGYKFDRWIDVGYWQLIFH